MRLYCLKTLKEVKDAFKKPDCDLRSICAGCYYIHTKRFRFTPNNVKYCDVNKIKFAPIIYDSPAYFDPRKIGKCRYQFIYYEEVLCNYKHPCDFKSDICNDTIDGMNQLDDILDDEVLFQIDQGD